MGPGFFDALSSHSYERLSTNIRSRIPPQKQRRWLIGIGVFVVISLTLWTLARRHIEQETVASIPEETSEETCTPPPPPYVPLDHYKYINTLPLIHNDTIPSLANQRGVFTSLYSNSFALAVAVLGHSVRKANNNARLIVPYIASQVSDGALCVVKSVGWEPHAVPLLPPPHNSEGISDRFRDQYTKLRIWSLGDELGIKSAVYLDADTLVLRNFDELFDLPWELGATTDVYGDDRGFAITFNAGVLAFRPSKETFEKMTNELETANYPPEQAEQAFLNLYFGAKVLRLPYMYNGNMAVKYRSSEVWKEIVDEMRVLHYTTVKPFWDWYVPNEELVTPERTREIIQARLRDNDFFKDEINWWKEIFEELMQEKEQDIRACYL
ncbi:hypothetical protein VKT23_010678 [Stygiomarasmius scandens]|uniref:Nucleotide-diphospho-sugar transferase n=1 Tax=Marasmiellus scandens TaxID=2682957 RepID=A0ABR1JBT9_9AGAR